LLAARRSRTDLVNADAGVRATLIALATGLGTVAAYVPLPTEPGGPQLPDALAAVCGRLLLPVLRADLDLDWAQYAGALVRAGRGLREPAGPRLGPGAVAGADLVIVPALAVDRRGVRLGRGRGFYDRSLTGRNPGARLIAMVRDVEFVDELPAEPHDVAMTHALTPERGLVALAAGE
jgi:5-formyltetrahydrofolate cyclo-ligase